MSQSPNNLWQAVLSILNRIPVSISGRIPVDASVADAATATNQITQVQRLVEIRDFVNPVTKLAVINISGLSGAGDMTIISPSATTKSLRISGLYFNAPSLVSVTLKSGAVSLSGPMPLTDHAADYSYPLCLGINQPFVINLGSPMALSGYVVYWEV